MTRLEKYYVRQITDMILTMDWNIKSGLTALGNGPGANIKLTDQEIDALKLLRDKLVQIRSSTQLNCTK